MASHKLFGLISAIAVTAVLTACGGKNNAIKPTPPAGQAQQDSQTSQSSITLTDRYADSGIDFKLGHGGRTPLTIQDTIGHGIALIDVDGDGLLDIVMTGPDRVRLYKNLGGFRFQDVTANSGLRQQGYWTGIATGDIDHDGKPDLVLCAKGGFAIYRNADGFHFEDKTAESGLACTDSNRWNSAALLFDYDKDGLPDLFIGAYVSLGNQSGLCPGGPVLMACGPQNFKPQFGALYHNEGGFKFRKCPVQPPTHGKVLGLLAGDIYGTGDVELYIANDVMEADMLHRLPDGTWKSEGVVNGTAYGPDGRAMGGMGIGISDYDGDGRLDMAVGTFSRDPRSLFHNDGGSQFSNRAFQAGIVTPCTFQVAFGTQLVDLDNDTWPDLVMVNGHVQDNVEKSDPQIHYAETTLVMHNEGNGRFKDVSSVSGKDVMRPIVGRCLCAGDLDNDGRIDLVAEDLEGAPLILQNTSHAGHWLRVKLAGKKSVTDGQGAIVTVKAGGRTLVRMATTGGSYFSASDPRVHFGVGTADKIDSVTIKWPTGKVTTLPAGAADRELLVAE